MIEIVELDPPTTADLIPRHKGNGNPKIFPESEYGKPNPKGKFYTRTTTFIDALDDKSSLTDWKLRLLLEGVTRQPSILEEYRNLVDPFDTDKPKVNKLAEKAITAAGGGAKAEIGDILHKITERNDLGQSLGAIPPDFVKDIEAYVAATEGIEMLSVEEFCVQDDLEFAGTFDRALRVRGELASALGKADGSVLIGDVKTGRIDLARGKFGMQFAGYAHMKRYDPVTYKRSPLVFDGEQVAQDVALLIHLPAGGGSCTLYPVDIERGWRDLLLAAEVREYRKFWNRKSSEFKAVRSVEL